jgi:hypothetical protein
VSIRRASERGIAGGHRRALCVRPGLHPGQPLSVICAPAAKTRCALMKAISELPKRTGRKGGHARALRPGNVHSADG